MSSEEHPSKQMDPLVFLQKQWTDEWNRKCSTIFMTRIPALIVVWVAVTGFVTATIVSSGFPKDPREIGSLVFLALFILTVTFFAVKIMYEDAAKPTTINNFPWWDKLHTDVVSTVVEHILEKDELGQELSSDERYILWKIRMDSWKSVSKGPYRKEISERAGEIVNKDRQDRLDHG